MASPPPDQNEDSNKITMVIEKWKRNQIEQISPVQRISGYPWHLRLSKCDSPRSRALDLHCDKSTESVLWRCGATIKTSFSDKEKHVFNSWKEESQKKRFILNKFKEGTVLEVTILTKSDGDACKLRPIINLLEPRDEIIVIGKEKNEIHVNKMTLASNSCFFRRLFNGSPEERVVCENELGQVEPEEFTNILNMFYGLDDFSLDDANLRKVLHLAILFHFESVEHQVVCYLLSSSSSLNIHDKLLISEQYGLYYLKDKIVQLYTRPQLEYLINSTEWHQLSRETIGDLFKKRCRLLKRMHGQYYSAAPPSKDPATISMVVENWAEGQYEQFSPVHRINGFPWRLRIYKGSPGTHSRLEVYCDKSNESELWECEARFTYSKTRESSWNVFKSWSESGQMARFWLASNFEVGFRLEVSISTSDDGNTWRSRPTLDPLEPLDGILVFGEEKKKIRVSKKSLASLSHYFDALFNGNFQERNMNEIPIGDVEYEEFLNIIKIVYGFAGASVTDENMIRLLLLADRFELKVVEDKVVSYILSSSCSLSIHEKLLISDQFNHTFLKERLISTYTKSQLIALSDSPEWAELSENMTRDIVKRCCKLTG